jgi:hypothetical protein
MKPELVGIQYTLTEIPVDNGGTKVATAGVRCHLGTTF